MESFRMGLLFLFVMLSGSSAWDKKKIYAWAPESFIIPNYYNLTYTRPLGSGETEPPFQFEGVDYNAMPEELRDYHHDCYAHYFDCLKNTLIMSPVCGYNKRSGYFEHYYSICEIDLKNCNLRRKVNMKGNSMVEGQIYYNGEQFNCVYYARMGGNMLENYFSIGDNPYDYKKDNVTFYIYNNVTYYV